MDKQTLHQQQSIIGVSLLAKLVQDLGMALGPILLRSKIAPALLTDPKAHISFQQEINFVAAMLENIQDPNIGFKAGERYGIGAFGSIGMAAVSCESAEQAIRFFMKYIRLSYTHFEVSFFKNNHQGVLRFKDQYDLKNIRRFYIERDFAFVMVSMRDLFLGAQNHQGIEAIHFDFACPTNVADYETFYGCPVKFNMHHNEILLNAAYLKLPLPQANALTRQLLEEQCEQQRLDILGPRGYVEKIRQIIQESHEYIPNMEEMASQFNLTSRTLRRKLNQQDYCFQTLLKEELSGKAIRLLETTTLTIEQISLRLGYGESANFSHAFKRWTGKTPKCYRHK